MSVRSVKTLSASMAMLAVVCTILHGRSIGQSSRTQSDPVHAENVAAVLRRLQTLLSDISVSKESVMRSMYPAPHQPVRELTIEWETKEDVTSKASNEERLSIEGIMAIVKSQPSQDAMLRDQDGLNLVSEQVLVIGISSKQELTWWTVVGDPRFMRAPMPQISDPPHVYQERLRQHIELMLLPKCSFFLIVPDDKRTAEMRFYHPGATEDRAVLKLIGKVSF